MERGVSLIELALGVVVGGIIAISAARFISSSKQAQVNATLRAQTEQRMREFLETTKKQIAQSRNSYPGASTILNNPYQNRNCSFVVNGNPSLANCGDAALRFSILNMDRYLDANNIATYFTQNITTECVAPSPGVPIQPFEVTAIQECSPCVGGQVPVIRSRFSNRPGLVLRFSGGAEAPATANVADDGTTLASSLCISHNPLSIPNDPNSFTTLSIRIRTLVRENQRARLLEMSSVIAMPRAPSGGVRVLSTGQ